MNTSLFNIISIGYFNVDDRIYTVFLFNIEGNIPHFHIWDTKTSGTKFHTTIKIELPEYLHKGDELDEKMKLKLMEFLKSRPKNPRYTTIYEYICSMWNDNSSPETMKVNEYAEIPDFCYL